MQALVSRHPEVIVGDDRGSLFITRGQAIGDGAGRRSLDHLFVTRGAVPVVVELKLAVQEAAE